MRSLLLTITGAVLLAAPARADRYEIGAGSWVIFESSAPLETFEGKTDGVTGTLDLGPAAAGDSVDLSVQVDMATLDTGLSLRDRNMRENHLHTDEFPHASFRAGKILEGALGDALAGARDLTVEGEMTLHGVTRKIPVPLLLSFEDGGTLRIQSEFEISLSDYDIPRPKFLIMKLNEVQKIHVDLVASPVIATESPEPAEAEAPE